METKITVWSGKAQISGLSEPACADGQLLVMVHGLSQELSENPAIYTGDDHTLWIYFPHSCFVCDDLMEDYGIPGALILREFPFSFRGNTEALEPGEIICSLEKDRLRMELKNVSGPEYQELCDLTLWVKLDSSEHCRELEDMLRQMDWRNEFAALTRTRYVERVMGPLPQLHADTHFRFLPLSPEVHLGDCVSNLSVERQKELWMVFFQDGISPVEFTYMADILAEGTPFPMFSWELSLRLALHEAGIRVEYPNHGGFQVWDGAGKRRLFNYENGTAAERLFLKLLFPAPAGQV